MAGTELRYGDPGGHPLLGTRLRDLTALRDGREIRLYELLRGARGQLIELDGEALRASSAAWRARVDYQSVTMCAGDALTPEVRALLVRPDGYLCWVGTSVVGGDHAGVGQALSTWFGGDEQSRKVAEVGLKSG